MSKWQICVIANKMAPLHSKMPGSMQMQTHTHLSYLSVLNTYRPACNYIHPSVIRLKDFRDSFLFLYNCILTFNFIHWSLAVSLVGQAWDSLWLEKKKSTSIDAHTHLWVCAINVYMSSFATLLPMNNVLHTCLHEEETRYATCSLNQSKQKKYIYIKRCIEEIW